MFSKFMISCCDDLLTARQLLLGEEINGDVERQTTAMFVFFFF